MSSPMPKISWECKKRIIKMASSGDSDETYFDGSPLRDTTVKETIVNKEVITNDSNPGFQSSHTSILDGKCMNSIDTQMSGIKLSDSRSPRHTGSSRKLSWKEPVASCSRSRRGKHFPTPLPKENHVATQINGIQSKLNKISIKLTRSLLAGGRPLTCDEAELMLQKTQWCLQRLNKLHHGSPAIFKDARCIADKIIKRVNKKIRELEEEYRESQQCSVDRANAAWFNDGSSLDISTRSQSKMTNDLDSQPSKPRVSFENKQAQAQSSSQTQMITKGFTLSCKHFKTKPLSSKVGNSQLTHFQTQSQLQRSENSSLLHSQMQFNGRTTGKRDHIQLNITEMQTDTVENLARGGLSQMQNEFVKQSQLQEPRDSTASPSLLTPEGENQAEVRVESESQARSKANSFEGSSDMFASYDCQQMPWNEDDATEVGMVGGNFEENTRKSTDDERVLPNEMQRTTGLDSEFNEMSNLSNNLKEKVGNSNDGDDVMVLSCVMGELTEVCRKYDEAMDETNENQDRNRSPKAYAENTGGDELQLDRKLAGSSKVRDIDSQTSSSADFSQDFIEDTQPGTFKSFRKLVRKENFYIEKGGSNSLIDLPNNRISLPLHKERERFVTKPWKKPLSLEDRMLRNTTQLPSEGCRSILKTNSAGSSMSNGVQFNKNVHVLGLSGVAQAKQNKNKKGKSGEKSGLVQDSFVASKDLSAFSFPQSSDSMKGKPKENLAEEPFSNVSGQYLICENVLSDAVSIPCSNQNGHGGKTNENSMTQTRTEKNVIVSSSSGKLDVKQRRPLETHYESPIRIRNVMDNVRKEESLTQMMLEDSQDISQTPSSDFVEKSSMTKVSVGKSNDMLSLSQKILMDSQGIPETQPCLEFIEPSMANFEGNNSNEQTLTQMMLEDSQETCNPLTNFFQLVATNIYNTASGKQLATEMIVNRKENNTKSPTECGDTTSILNLEKNGVCDDQALTQMMLESGQELSLRSHKKVVTPSKLTGAIPKVRPANVVMKSPKATEKPQIFGKCSFQPFVAPKSAVLGVSCVKVASSKTAVLLASQSRLSGRQESDKNNLLQQELNHLATEISIERQFHSQNGTFGMKNDHSQTFGAVAKLQKQVSWQKISPSHQVAAEINTLPRHSGERSQESQTLTLQMEHEFLQPEIPAKKSKKRPLPVAFPVTRKFVPVTSTYTASHTTVSADSESCTRNTQEATKEWSTRDIAILNKSVSSTQEAANARGSSKSRSETTLQEATKTPASSPFEIIDIDSPPLEVCGNYWWSRDLRKMTSCEEHPESPMECTSQNAATDVHGCTKIRAGNSCLNNWVNLVENTSQSNNPISNGTGEKQIPMKQINVQSVSVLTAMNVDVRHVAPMKLLAKPNSEMTKRNGTQNPSAKQASVLPEMTLSANQYGYFTATLMVESTTQKAQKTVNATGNQQGFSGAVSRRGFVDSFPSHFQSAMSATNSQSQAKWHGTNPEPERETSTPQQSLIGNIRQPFSANSNQFPAQGTAFHQIQNPKIVKMATNQMTGSLTQQQQGRNQTRNGQQLPVTVSQPQTRFEFQTVTQTAKPVPTQPCQKQNTWLSQNQAAAASDSVERYETFDRLILNLFDYENVMKRRAMERQNSVGSETQMQDIQRSVEQTASSKAVIPKPAAKKSTSFLTELLYPKNLDPAQAAERDMILSLTHMRVKPAQNHPPRTKPFGRWTEADLKLLEDSSDDDS